MKRRTAKKPRQRPPLTKQEWEAVDWQAKEQDRRRREARQDKKFLEV